MEKLIVIGGGGHAKVCIDLIRESGKFEIAGIVDKNLPSGTVVHGVTVLGNDEKLPEIFSGGIKNVSVALGSVTRSNIRRELFEKAKGIGFFVPSLVHPAAIVSPSSTISEGAQVMAGAILQTDCKLGENSIVNSGAIIEHDCDIGKHVHVCPGAVISGGVSIGDNCFIGAAAVIIQSAKIGANTLVGAGAVVVGDVPAGSRVVGVPAK